MQEVIGYAELVSVFQIIGKNSWEMRIDGVLKQVQHDNVTIFS
jgi:hypothetical protein